MDKSQSASYTEFLTLPAGHNLRMILAHLRVLYFAVLALLALLFSITIPPNTSPRRSLPG